MELTDRQLEIIRAACKRIDEHGIQELTTKKLAADIGLSEAALYRHFASKNDILMALLDFFFDQLKPLVAKAISSGESASKKVQAFMMVPFSLFAQNPAIAGVIFSDGIFHFDQQLREKIYEIIHFNQKTLTSLLVEGQAVGQIRSDIGPMQLAPMVMGSMRFTVSKWKMEGHRDDLLVAARDACAAVGQLIEPPTKIIAPTNGVLKK